ncbi:EAL domain-containing protein [Williamsia serinedens]|uniref:EAL domain-containing protein n=1 Tax=Williamsia serinedens TaxID=391736 RepID=A0ABT1H2N6_9NOCA|nr:EAL domain-containing protein [Williamsia serinedens]MCP2161504.1 EAL domain-containing protein [Williamsia serinedens]
MSAHGTPSDAADSSLAALGVTARVRGVHHLSDGALAARVVGLSGPVGSRLESQDALRRVAAVMQQTAALDDYAIGFRRDLSLPDDLPVMTLVDPETLARRRDHSIELSMSVDAHDVAMRPRRSVEAVDAARVDGRRVCVRIGLDDLGPAVLPVVDPDVVILRAEVVRRVGDPAVARLVQEMAAHLESSTAAVVAEGIDGDGDVDTAISLGAHYGVGAHFTAVRPIVRGSAFPLPRHRVPPGRDDRTPFGIVAATHRPRRGGKSLLEEMSRSLQAQATGSGSSCLLVRSTADSCDLSHLSARTWDGPSREVAISPVYGVRVPLVSAGRVAGDDGRAEWNVAVLGPHVCAALTARLTEAAPDGGERFEFVQTYDRATVVAVVRAMLLAFDDTD